MKFAELKTGDIFKLVESYPSGFVATYMKIGGDCLHRAIHYNGWQRGMIAEVYTDSSVEVTDISHG